MTMTNAVLDAIENRLDARIAASATPDRGQPSSAISMR